jgi:hypothetical protein
LSSEHPDAYETGVYGNPQRGTRCAAQARAGSELCFFHDPADTERRKAARRTGGLSRSRPAAVRPLDAPNLPLRSIQDVANLLADTIHHVLKGQLDPRVANAASHLGSVLIRALQQADVERRLADLEHVMLVQRVDDRSRFHAEEPALPPEVTLDEEESG